MRVARLLKETFILTVLIVYYLNPHTSLQLEGVPGVEGKHQWGLQSSVTAGIEQLSITLQSIIPDRKGNTQSPWSQKLSEATSANNEARGQF